MSLPKEFKSSKKVYRRKRKGHLGQGGNGTVNIVEVDGKKYALKSRMLGLNSKQKERFVREIAILKDIQHLDGVVKMVDYYLGDENQEPFYVMEIAVPASEWVKGKRQVEIMEALLELAKTLQELEQNSIAHRDIKPENILFIDDKPFLSDFGLAYRDGDDRITCEGDRQIGAKMTMAPEMFRNPYNAEFHKADVYSYAKTLWMLITRDSECFDGTYSTHGKESLWNYDVEILGEVEDLLAKCTSNFPDVRWTYSKIISCLNDWIEITREEDSRRKEAWRHLKKRIFPYTQPEVAEWTDVDEIINVFELVVNKECWNHSFFPSGGGLELSEVKKSCENGCLEFEFQGFIHIIKPKKLSFYSSGGVEHGEQDYFILEADSLDFISPDQTGLSETLTRISPSEYTNPQCAYWNDFNGEELPETARVIERWREGKFAIFMGASLYNRRGVFLNGKWVDAYSAPHNSLNERVFFDFFKMVYGKKGCSIEEVKTYLKPERTRLKDVLLNEEQVTFIRKFIDDYSKINDNDSKGESRIVSGLDIDWEKYKAVSKQKKDIINELSDEDLQLLNAVMYSRIINSPPYGHTLTQHLSHHTDRNGNENALLGRSVKGVCNLLKDGLAMYT